MSLPDLEISVFPDRISLSFHAWSGYWLIHHKFIELGYDIFSNHAVLLLAASSHSDSASNPAIYNLIDYKAQ